MIDPAKQYELLANKALATRREMADKAELQRKASFTQGQLVLKNDDGTYSNLVDVIKELQSEIKALKEAKRA
jgi:hypothetical protein